MTTADTLFALIYRGKCPECHRRLYRKDGYTPAARFCSDACRAKRWHRRRRREKWKAAGDRLCETCGTPLQLYVGQRGDARFCSHACRQAAYRKRKTAERIDPDRKL